jgi:hypothetical protein
MLQMSKNQGNAAAKIAQKANACESVHKEGSGCNSVQ